MRIYNNASEVFKKTKLKIKIKLEKTDLVARRRRGETVRQR
jgi:hypothetical protein